MNISTEDEIEEREGDRKGGEKKREESKGRGHTGDPSCTARTSHPPST